MNRRPARWARPAGSLVGLAAVFTVLVRLGHGPLAAPDHWTVAGLRAWTTGHDPVIVALAFLRLCALAAAGQLAVAVGLASAARVLRLPALLQASHLVSIPGTRGLVRHLAGASLSMSTLISPVAGHAAARAPIVLERIGPPSQAEAVLTRVADAVSPPRTATLRRVDGPPTATLAPVDPAGSATPGQPPPPLPPQPEAAGGHVVVPGDHLWSISESTLRGAWGRQPTEAETDRYWRAVVAANPQVADPDLVFPGQRINLPPPTS